MTKIETAILHALLEAVRREFEIPQTIDLSSGGGEVRIVASAALVSPKLCEEFDSKLNGAREMAGLFNAKMIKSISIVGGLIAERPLIDEAAFCQCWENEGIRAAVAGAHINPVHTAHIHRLVRITSSYCVAYSLNCTIKAPELHFEHLKPLRYILHASTS